MEERTLSATSAPSFASIFTRLCSVEPGAARAGAETMSAAKSNAAAPFVKVLIKGMSLLLAARDAPFP